jgi:hypothetical protein
MKSLHVSALILFSALGLMNCSGSVTDPGPGKRIKLEISKQIYQSGDTVSINVINLSDIQLTYPGDFCPKGLQRFGGGTWADVALPDSGQGCPFSIGVLAPRAQQTVSVPLPTDLTTDVYRIVLPAATVDITNPNLAEPSLLTPEFTVNSRT